MNMPAARVTHRYFSRLRDPINRELTRRPERLPATFWPPDPGKVRHVGAAGLGLGKTVPDSPEQGVDSWYFPPPGLEKDCLLT